MISYIRNNQVANEDIETDMYGNRVRKDTGAYVIVIASSESPPSHKPISLTKVDGNWVPMQMEFNFG